MHLEVLAGRIGLDEARRERFRKVFLALGVTLDAAEAGGGGLGVSARVHDGRGARRTAPLRC